jgi:deazaflavin-dependent oxidoreductase (nitroreductase family)
MPKSLVDLDPSRGLLRFALRAPVYLYRVHLGWLLGGRFLMLTHIGRKSGQPHQTVLEVVSNDRETGEYVIASGWRGKADWYRNILKTPQVTVNSGRRQFKAMAVQLSVEEAEAVLSDYARRHSLAFRELGGVISGRQIKNQEESVRYMAQEIPLIALKPDS